MRLVKVPQVTSFAWRDAVRLGYMNIEGGRTLVFEKAVRRMAMESRGRMLPARQRAEIDSACAACSVVFVADLMPEEAHGLQPFIDGERLEDILRDGIRKRWMEVAAPAFASAFLAGFSVLFPFYVPLPEPYAGSVAATVAAVAALALCSMAGACGMAWIARDRLRSYRWWLAFNSAASRILGRARFQRDLEANRARGELP